MENNFTEPLVAVYMITYNHGQYIEEAIQSVLCQKTNFKFKLIIGDDCSKDQTTEICLRFQTQYPDQIQVLTNESNVGIFQNAGRVFNACVDSGAKYIALLEGDDYWSSPEKLQKQVDVLESDESIAGSYHNTDFLYSDGKIKSMRKELALRMNLEQVISKFAPFHTSSFVFRAKNFCWPSWFQNIDSVDLALYVWHAQFGRLIGFNENWSVYRIHSTSLTAGESHRKNFDDRRVILHRMMRGKIQHNHWDKYGLLIQHHLNHSKGNWSTDLPVMVVFFEDEAEPLNWEWQCFKMKLNAEIVNVQFGRNKDCFIQGKRVGLFKDFKFLNRFIWRWKLKNKMRQLPQHIFFTKPSNYHKFKEFFGRSNINVHLMFPLEMEQLEIEKSNYPNIQSADWLSFKSNEKEDYLLNWV